MNGKKKNKSQNKAQQQLKANTNISNNERDDKPVDSKEKEVPSTIGNKVTINNHNVIILDDSMVKNLQGWKMKILMKGYEKVMSEVFQELLRMTCRSMPYHP